MLQASFFARGVALLFYFHTTTQAAYQTNYPSHNLNTTYYSRPDIIAPKFQFSVYDEDSVIPGYILLTPATQGIESSFGVGGGGGFSFSNDPGSGTPQAQLAAYYAQSIQNGPYIFDTSGELVYSGFGSAGGFNFDNLKVAQYQGKPHLTYFNGDDQTGPSGSRGQGVIMDSSYRIVTSVTAGLGRTSNDGHEYTVLEDGTAITTIYQPVQYDLTPYGVKEPVGWVVEGIFQRIDIQTGSVLFEWRSLDHTTLAESYFPLNVTSGVGASPDNPYDYFHINAVELDQYGNYLVSSRHLSTIFYLSGTTGSVIWRLNGKNSTFTLLNFHPPFAFQHDARIRSQNTTHMQISLFDNGSSGKPTNSSSSGMLISLNLPSKTAALTSQFVLPDSGILTTSRGSVQALPTNQTSPGAPLGPNVFIGWGSQPFVSEHKPDGSPVLIGQFGATHSALALSYRAFKIGRGEWVASPLSTPALWMTANNSNSSNSSSHSGGFSTAFYVSWNGATEVVAWRFYSADGGGNSTGAGNGTLMMPAAAQGEGGFLGEVARGGFETAFVAAGFYAAGFARAVDKQGKVLGESPVRRTYVPSQ